MVCKGPSYYALAPYYDVLLHKAETAKENGRLWRISESRGAAEKRGNKNYK